MCQTFFVDIDHNRDRLCKKINLVNCINRLCKRQYSYKKVSYMDDKCTIKISGMKPTMLVNVWDDL